MLLERTATRPIETIPAGSGPAAASPLMFEEDAFGPTRTRVRVPVPLSYLMMVAALAESDNVPREELQTPADIRWQVEFEVAFRGWDAVHQAAEKLIDAGIENDDWLLFCHQAVITMLTADGVASGLDRLTADEMIAALTVYGDLSPANLATPAAVRWELTRIAYLHGLDDLRANAARLAAKPYQVGAPAFDTEAHAWPGFCRQAVTAMLAATGALAGAR